MDSDPHQMNNKAWSAVPTIGTRLTETVETMRVASGQERRRLEEV
ncbi:MAG: hypothetical protein WKF53_07555 [Rubrobacter sp.]